MKPRPALTRFASRSTKRRLATSAIPCANRVRDQGNPSVLRPLGLQVSECPGRVYTKCVQDPGCWSYDCCSCRCCYPPGCLPHCAVPMPAGESLQKGLGQRNEDQDGQLHQVRARSPHPSSAPIRSATWCRNRRLAATPAATWCRKPARRLATYCVCHMVPETRTKTCTYCVCHMVPEQKTCSYTVCHMVPENRTKTCTYTVCHMVPETHTKTCTYCVCHMVPETRTKTAPTVSATWCRNRRPARTPCATWCRKIARRPAPIRSRHMVPETPTKTGTYCVCHMGAGNPYEDLHLLCLPHGS